jgi:UDP-2-acetamido-2-deoxy-ribo-hexuluronate aminotransferase
LPNYPHYPGEVKTRGEIGARYTQELEDVCITPTVQKGNTHVYAQYTIRTPNRDGLGEFLKSQGIPNAVYYPKCIHEQPVYKHLGYKIGDFPQAEKASKEVISLPMHPWITSEEQDTIIQAVKNGVMAHA